MKREIKFRGYGKQIKMWFYGCLDTLSIPSPRIMLKNSEGEVFSVEVIPETVGQFTGLYDKNGKEIYEGDVIRWFEIEGTNNNSFLEPPDDRIAEISGVVEFKDGMFCVLNEDKLLDYIVAFFTKDYQGDDPDMFEYVYNLDKFPNITTEDMYICEVIGNIHDNKELLTQN